MQQPKIQNIRNTLKSIFDSYESVSDFIFTTYDFDPKFIEEHIVPFLMGNDKKISTYGELKAADEWICRNNLCVYYDINALKVSDRLNITLPTYPKQIDNYVFHPKVIVIFGEIKKKKGQKNGDKSISLIVSSCNLTVSGYGRNLECFSCIKVETQQVADSLYSFLDWLRGEDKERHNEICDYLRNMRFIKNDSIEFFWNDGKSNLKLLRKLSELPKGDLTIISPYFDANGPEEILQSIDGKEQITIMPALDGDHYNIHLSDYLMLKNMNIRFANVSQNGNENRFVHAKFLCKGEYRIIGSYNFTDAAMNGHNAEAALIIRNKEKIKIQEQTIVEDKFCQENEMIVNKDEMENKTTNIFVSIMVDWGNNKLTIDAKLPANKSSDDCLIRIDGVSESEHPGWKITENPTIELDDKSKKVFIKHKVFSVFYKDVLCMKGIISEKDWLGIRPELVCDSLDETILEWYEDESNKTRNKVHNYDLRPISEEETEFEYEKVSNSGDIFDNYYLVSYSLGRLCREIKKYGEIITKDEKDKSKDIVIAERNIYSILNSKPGCMMNILGFVLNDMKKRRDIVFYWLVIEYLKRAYHLLPLPDEFRHSGLSENYSKQREQFADKLKIAESNIKKRINCRPEYLKWIEKELFVNEEENV